MAIASGSFDDDAFFKHQRALQKLVEEVRLVNDALGPGFQIQEAIRREQEEIKRSSSYRYWKKIEDDARRHKQMLDAVQGELGRQQLKAINDDAVRQREFVDALTRQKELVDSVTSISLAEFQRNAQMEQESRRLLDPASAFESLTARNSTFDALRGLRVEEDLQKWARQEQARQQILNAATFAVNIARESGISGIDASQLSSAFSDALEAEGENISDEEPLDLWTFALRLARAISERFPNIDVNRVFDAYVTPLMFMLITIGVADVLSTRANERLARASNPRSRVQPHRDTT